MFVDEMELTVRGGRGGDGMVSFRREKYVAKGGPDGGDGGDGGSVYLWADPGKHSFLDLRYKHIFKAPDGSSGRTKNRHGATGEDLLVPVPLGTVIRDHNDRIIADLTAAGQRALVAPGGRGGKGNARFASSRRRVPRIAEKGLPGTERMLKLELKLIAQVGLVGFPNAGKSTLLSRISEAKPKVAAYPFTTLTPNLGVVSVGEGGSFVVADLPGLIEGASEGAGLGHRFLRHVERNLLLVFLIDLSPAAHPAPDLAYRQLLEELRAYNPDLVGYPKVVVGNKIDLQESVEQYNRLEDAVREKADDEISLFAVSAVTGQGVKEMLRYLLLQVNKLAEGKTLVDDEELIRAPELEEKPLAVEKIDDIFLISGTAVERAAARTDFDNEDALLRFQKYTKRSGLDRELRKQGIKEGDTVRIGDEEFIFYD